MTEKSNTNAQTLQEAIQDMADRCIAPDDGVTTAAFFCMSVGLTPEGSEFVDQLEEDETVPVSRLHEFLRFSCGNCGNESLNKILLEGVVRSILRDNPDVREKITAGILHGALEFMKKAPDELEQAPSIEVH